MRRRTMICSVLISLLSLVVFSGVVSAASLNGAIYDPLTPSSTMGGLAAGPDGNMWASKPLENQIIKVSMAGVVTEYTMPSGTAPTFLTAGPDGNMWMTTGTGVGKVLKVNTSGTVIATYDISSNLGAMTGFGIITGPDGNMWINAGYETSATGGKILKITPSGTVTQYPTSNGSYGIAKGSDGNMWFAIKAGAANSVNYIGKITMAGVVTEYPLPGTGDGVGNVAPGPDGNMWYLRLPNLNGRIGKITTGGVANEYTLTPGSFSNFGLVAGPDGRMWFNEYALNKVGAADMSGNITEYDIANITSGPISLALGADSNIWFTTPTKIGNITNTPQSQVDPDDEDPDPTPSPSPSAPRSGRIIGAVVASIAIISVVVLAGLEVKKNHLENSKSNK